MDTTYLVLDRNWREEKELGSGTTFRNTLVVSFFQLNSVELVSTIYAFYVFEGKQRSKSDRAAEACTRVPEGHPDQTAWVWVGFSVRSLRKSSCKTAKTKPKMMPRALEMPGPEELLRKSTV